MNDPFENTADWQAWLSRHGPRLVLFARRWAHDHSDAEDLVQEAFVRFWRTRDQVRDPLSYIYKSVRNLAIDAARSNGARVRREALVSNENEVSPLFQSPLEDEERRRSVELALAELPDKQAEVVTLKVWSLLSYAQIAEITSTPIGTVASRYRYAIEKLRRTMTEHDFV